MAEAINVTRIVSGVQPTGEMHLGNYLGALRHWTKLQTEAEYLYLVADLHALTVAQDPGELRQRILATAALLIAIGIDPLGPTEENVQVVGVASETIRLTDSPDIRARIRAAVTDSGRDVIASADKPALRNLLTVYSIVAGTSVTDAQERFAGKGYAEF